ncbi:TPA: aldolase [Candidatus Dependentiae bacterium]|nr:MAG: Fructose-bisphosphate aldolase [candidate division TM6 bacterium GW2011_GWE2_31_21]KKP52537.1 MAG: Fructose-bisphosphate aldolase [candidate division TM6 bacterium GW2011_GWF2_33_332]HBS48443.1 aldolase [Candidatus Dependentiae bacterium]HBZ73292.1 aldolase [Candidatus Dependentiae bacterium]
MKNNKFSIPLTVPTKSKAIYEKNYDSMTRGSGKLFLFAADQKIEHLNQDFYGPNLPALCNDPKSLFEIASKSKIGAFATHLGLIARYGEEYSSVNYVIKLNGKSSIVSTAQEDPLSLFLVTPQEVVDFKNQSQLNIVAMGYTIYLGSKYEAQMMRQASEMILHAHQNGMIAILWIYPRGQAIKNEREANLLAGAAGVGAALGADFIKINPPISESLKKNGELLMQATQAAGKSRVICAGGSLKDEKAFLQELYDQIYIGGTSGCAVGRNIFQKDVSAAIKFCDSIASVVFDGKIR